MAGRIAASGRPITVKPITAQELPPLDIEPLADVPTLTTFHMTQEGDSFWSLAKSDLGAGASAAAIQARAQQYMEVNAGVDPRAIPTNYFLTVPGDGVTVSSGTAARYASSDAEYRQYLAVQAERAASDPWAAFNQATLTSLPGGQSVSFTDWGGGSSGSVWDNTFTHGAQGLFPYLGQNLIRADDVRLGYASAASRLDPLDSAGRSALKEATRLETPAPQRAIIQAMRPSTGPRVGSVGGAARTNAAWTTAARVGRNVGRGAVGVSIALDAAEIATSDNPARAASGVAVANVGGIAGGIAGAEAGAWVGAGIGVWFGGAGAAPGAAIGAVVGGIAGSIGLGMVGHEVGTGIYDDVTGRRR